MKNEILVIDDNFDIRNLISNILKDKNYNVREAANYDQAAFEIDKQLPDLAVIDVKLDKGDKDGIDLLKKIKQISDLVPVIMISGHANVEMAVESLKLGAYEFITKPFAPEQLLNFVSRGLENIRLRFSRIITIEEGIINGGFGDGVSGWLLEAGFSGRLKRLGLPDTFVEHGSRDQILSILGLDSDGLLKTIQDMVDDKKEVHNF